MKNSSFRFSIFPLILLLCLIFSCEKQREKVDVKNTTKDDLELDKIPKMVMDALKAKFPKAEIQMWTEEKEGEIMVWDIEFKQESRKFEADIKEDGTYINYEKAIEAKDLPKVVSDAIMKKYAKATLKEIMEETEVKGNDEKLSAYEVVLVTAEKKEVELRLSPNGKILEDTGTHKEEKK